jgi:hypothetical protein
MRSWDRRDFLSSLSVALIPFAAPTGLRTQARAVDGGQSPPCWLDVCAPYLIEDPTRGIHSEIILTSDTFAGARGYEDAASATEYDILLYDSTGRKAGGRRMSVAALRTTVIPTRELLDKPGPFWGGARIRLRPQCGMHASDLFSSAFIRWRTNTSFDNVHANPDPLQWQKAESFYYSMPFPALADYDCTFSLFNPYDAPSRGEIVLTDGTGKRLAARGYELKPQASLLFDLNSGNFIDEPWVKSATVARDESGRSISGNANGLLAVTNTAETMKSFGYLMIRRRDRFSVEHPIHQGLAVPPLGSPPFDPAGQFKARNVLYSPLLFRHHRVGDLTLESHVHFGSGRQIDESLWLSPFAVDSRGEAVWSGMKDENLAKQLASGQSERGAIRLRAGQSCTLDFSNIQLGQTTAGGLGVAVAPDTSHTLMKMEIRIPEWGAHAFTHFRPGLKSARGYQKPKERGGLATDYITAGGRLVTNGRTIEADEVIGVINIDDQGVEGRPQLEIFGPQGFIKRCALGPVPSFACRHYRLSELLPGAGRHEQLTLRLVDTEATMLMSTVHLDYLRRDLALDHGSDRFSTFLDYGCR